MSYPLNDEGDDIRYIDYVQLPVFHTNIHSERILHAKPQAHHLQICSWIYSSPWERIVVETYILLASYAIVYFGVSYFLDHHVFSFINKLLFICLAPKCCFLLFQILLWVIFPHNENSALVIKSTPNCQYLLLYTLLHLQPWSFPHFSTHLFKCLEKSLLG